MTHNQLKKEALNNAKVKMEYDVLDLTIENLSSHLWSNMDCQVNRKCLMMAGRINSLFER